MGAPQTKPKRLKLVVDVSGSMYRFNGHDGRLDRQMEAVVMVMEAFHGFQNQILYDIVGHSGEDYSIKFVESNNPPADNNQRLIVIKVSILLNKSMENNNILLNFLSKKYLKNNFFI